MSALADAAGYTGARSEVSERLDGLAAAVEAARGRLDDEVLDPADELAQKASDRLRLSGEHTIVALAGATGSGKSSLFNALSDLELAGVGVRRPTTSWALACAWGPDGAHELLEWMGIPARHQVSRMSMLDSSSADTKLEGLVLLDLPDHDSTEVSHHLEMDRLVRYADLLVWVLDPQKYADAAIHDRYIRPMAEYRDVTVVVLNQIDRIAPDDRARALSDVRQILAREGLPDVPVLGVSATGGEGIDDLKRELVRRISAKKSARDRLGTDVDAVLADVVEAGGRSEVPGISDVDRQALHLGLLDSVGAPQLASGLETALRRRAIRYTGWPPARWLGRLRRGEPSAIDPDGAIADLAGSLVPEVGRVQRSQAESAVRELAEKASVGLTRPWRDAVRAATVERGGEVVRALDSAVDSLDVDLARPAAWWRVVQVLQLLALAALVVGAAWWVLDLLPIGLPAPPRFASASLAVVLAVGGLLGGLVLGIGSRVAARASARRRADQVESTLRGAVEDVSREQVLDPVTTELTRYRTYRDGVRRAQA